MTQKPIERSDIDCKIDDFLHRMAAAETPEIRRMYSDRATALINQRNASRTPDQVAKIEAAKGLV